MNYTYDNEGQLATAGGTVLTFNCDQRLAEINDSGTIHQFSYDSRGNRIRVIRAGVETRYIYDPFGNLLAEADSLNQITRKYIYGKGLLALATPTARFCYHFNPTGSTIAVTDMAQAVVNSYAHEPFGQIRAQQETVPQPFKFVGRYGVMAEPNGLYYMRARYYDPSVGRFISEDPIGFAGGDVNLSAYVLNDPITLIDPLGLAIGDLPPIPPGYNPGNWVHGQWSNGRYWLEDPTGVKWTAHPEDMRHWRHWDKQGPGGDDQGRWPNNSKKPWENQKKMKNDQCSTDPSGNTEPYKPWTPDPSEYMPSGFLLPIPGLLPGPSGSPVGRPVRIPLRPVWMP